MRYFELILIVISVATCLWSIFLFNKGNISRKWICIANGAIFALHTIFEGVRWQMFIFYLICLSLFAYSLCIHFDIKWPRIPKIFKVFIKTIVILTTIASILLTYAMPVIRLPKPSGPYPISTMTLHLVDESRDELITLDANDHRELMVTIWYPSKTNKTSKHKPYVDRIQKFSSALAASINAPSFMFNYLDHVKTHSTIGTLVSDQEAQYPLLVFSHGLGIPSAFYTSIIEEITSHGYIIVTIDHTYSTLATTFPDGSIKTFETDADNFTDEDVSKLNNVWVQDIDFVINQMKQLNSNADSIMNNKIDMNRIGVFGHSFGGGAAYSALYSNKNIKAAVNIDGSVFELVETGEKKPFMLIASDDYAKSIKGIEEMPNYDNLSQEILLKLEKQNVTKEAYEETVKRIGSQLGVLKKGGLFLNITNTKHYNFSDISLASPLVSKMGLTGSIDKNKGIEILNAYILAFFNKYLKHEPQKLLEGSSNKYPEVVFETRE